MLWEYAGDGNRSDGDRVGMDTAFIGMGENGA